MESKNKKIKGLGFHHVAIKVKDFDKSCDFYVNGLGFTPVCSWGIGDGRAIMLDIGDGGIIEMFAGGEDNIPEIGKWQHFAMRATDIDSAYNKAIEAGAKPIAQPKVIPLDDAKPGKMTLKVAFVSGPDGEQLEFFSII